MKRLPEGAAVYAPTKVITQASKIADARITPPNECLPSSIAPTQILKPELEERKQQSLTKPPCDAQVIEISSQAEAVAQGWVCPDESDAIPGQREAVERMQTRPA